MINYEPNNARSIGYKHIVEVVLQQWEYQKTYIVEVCGSVSGLDALNLAVDLLFEKLEDNEFKLIHLQSALNEGDSLETNLYDSPWPVDTFKGYVVSVRIIGLEKDES